MGMFHYKAVLAERNPDGSFLYTFFPEFVMASDVSGTFVVTPGPWEPQIVTSAGAEERGLVSTDRRCVLALVAKLKAEYQATGEMPSELFRIS